MFRGVRDNNGYAPALKMMPHQVRLRHFTFPLYWNSPQKLFSQGFVEKSL